MPEAELLSNIQPFDLAKFKTEILSDIKIDSENAGIRLVNESARFGLTTREYLQLALKTEPEKGGLDGYEQVLYALNLPIRDNFADGVFLQAASETFQTYAGTRALFPEVIDDILRFAVRQDPFETVAPMLATSRTMVGNELLSTVIDDDSEARDSFTITEGANIPVRSIRTSQSAVQMFKHGSAIRTTYEFGRRAQLNLLVPHMNRILRELEISKVAVATNMLINGDGLAAAANEVDQSSFNTPTGVTATAGEISWPHLLYWLVQRAKASVPVDTVIMNWDGWFQWLMLFATQQAAAGDLPADSLQKAGVSTTRDISGISLGGLTPVLSSAVPANKLIGITKGETLEELIEAGADIQEQERNIKNQTITLTKTETTGYHLIYADTREIFDFGN